MRTTILFLTVFSLIGCGDDDRSGTDAGDVDTGMVGIDGGPMPDTGPLPDTGPTPDTGVMVDAGPPPANDDCAGAMMIAAPGTTMGSTLAATNDYDEGENCAGVAGADVVYSISVPAGQRLTATVENAGDGWDPSISLATMAACDVDPRVCLTGDDSGGADEVNSVSYTNTSGAAETIFIIIDSFSATMSGNFTLTTMLEIGRASCRERV